MIDNTLYVDLQGWECVYTKGNGEMSVVYRGQIYHWYNGLVTLAVF